MMPTKYNTPQVALHWLSATVIMFLLVTGTLVLANIENTVPSKVDNLRIHMLLGGLAFVLILGHIVWRAKTTQPEHLHTGNKFLDKLGAAAHYALNLTALLIAAGLYHALILKDSPFRCIWFGKSLPKILMNTHQMEI